MSLKLIWWWIAARWRGAAALGVLAVFVAVVLVDWRLSVLAIVACLGLMVVDAVATERARNQFHDTHRRLHASAVARRRRRWTR